METKQKLRQMFDKKHLQQVQVDFKSHSDHLFFYIKSVLSGL